MILEKDVTYSAPYFEWTYNLPHLAEEQYNKFINWVSGEFDLYLQDEQNGFKVYYPNGWLQITNKSKELDKNGLRIFIQNKSKKMVEILSNQMLELYNTYLLVHNPIQNLKMKVSR